MTEFNSSIVTDKGGHRVVLTVNGAAVESPPVEHLVFYVGLGVAVGVCLIELPTAVALAAGHLLIGLTNRPGLHALGEALDEA
jgi:hypothetical protein